VANSLALLQGLKRGLAWLAAAAVILAVACIVLPWLLRLFGLTLGISFLAFQFIGYTALCVLLLLFFWIMAEAGYKVFLRPSIRARHIRKIRDKRLRLEAAGRSGSAR